MTTQNKILTALQVLIISVLLIVCSSPHTPDRVPEQDVYITQDRPIEQSTNYDTVKQSYHRIDGLPRKFDTVPGGNNVFRSNQPTLSQLNLILDNYNITTVIRMNQEEGTGVYHVMEQKVCQDHNVKFIYINAHLGYHPNAGYVASLDFIQPYLKEGNILIHCTAGADRTGYQIAKYLQDNFNWSKDDLWDYVLKYNSWDRHICQGKWGYIKYMEAFYPYTEWKQQNYCK